MNRIFRRKDAPPILRGCISIIRRKRWKAQICDKGSTPKWALGGHPPPPNLGPCETLMAKWWRSCHTLLPTPSTTNEHAPFLDLRHVHLLKIWFPCQLFDEITFFGTFRIFNLSKSCRTKFLKLCVATLYAWTRGEEEVKYGNEIFTTLQSGQGNRVYWTK